MKKLALITIALLLAACATSDPQQANNKVSKADDDDYVTGSNIPRHNTGVKTMSAEDLIRMQQDMASQRAISSPLHSGGK